jgi:hypothetical protein
MAEISREPITIYVDHEPWYFYCRLFGDDEEHARKIYRQLALEAANSDTSILLIREPKHDRSWAILVYSSLQLALIAVAPFIADHGEPYYSDLMTEAVRRRRGALTAPFRPDNPNDQLLRDFWAKKLI